MMVKVLLLVFQLTKQVLVTLLGIQQLLGNKSFLIFGLLESFLSISNLLLKFGAP